MHTLVVELCTHFDIATSNYYSFYVNQNVFSFSNVMLLWLLLSTLPREYSALNNNIYEKMNFTSYGSPFITSRIFNIDPRLLQIIINYLQNDMF